MDTLQKASLKSKTNLSLYDAIWAWYSTSPEYQQRVQEFMEVLWQYDGRVAREYEDNPSQHPELRQEFCEIILPQMKNEMIECRVILKFPEDEDATPLNTFVSVGHFKTFLIQRSHSLNVFNEHPEPPIKTGKHISNLMYIAKMVEEAWSEGSLPHALTVRNQMIKWMEQKRNRDELKLSDANINLIATLLNPDARKLGGAPSTPASANINKPTDVHKPLFKNRKTAPK